MTHIRCVEVLWHLRNKCRQPANCSTCTSEQNRVKRKTIWKSVAGFYFFIFATFA